MFPKIMYLPHPTRTLADDLVLSTLLAMISNLKIGPDYEKYRFILNLI